MISTILGAFTTVTARAVTSGEFGCAEHRGRERGDCR